MKKLLLSLAFLALLAGAASAYVPLGKLQQTGTAKPNSAGELGRGGELVVGRTPEPIDRSFGASLNPPGSPGDETATRPVPEPGTMVLASMGLIALGAAARKRRGS